MVYGAGMTSSERQKKFYARNPWYRLWHNAKMRCTDPEHRSYKFYGALGIKFLLSQHDCEIIFARDGGHFMKCPSLDRRDSSQDYTAHNCRVIEKAINERLPHEVTTWQD